MLMKKELNALVVDDEDGARRLMNSLLKDTGHFTDVKLAASVGEAQDIIEDFDPDMIFLDIRMPGKDGFYLLEELKQNQFQPGIIFVTAHEEYAIAALQKHAFDYLLKPVDREQLNKCIIDFIDSRINKEDEELNPAGEIFRRIKRIKINTRTETIFINPESVLCCLAEGNYTTIVTGDKKYLCTMNIGKMEAILTQPVFRRIGRSLIINLEYLVSIDRKESAVTLQKNGQSIRIAVSKRHIRELENI